MHFTLAYEGYYTPGGFACQPLGEIIFNEYCISHYGTVVRYLKLGRIMPRIIVRWANRKMIRSGRDERVIAASVT